MKKVVKKKKDYFKNINPVQEKFLIERLKQEWQEAEWSLKKHQLIQRAKAGAADFATDLLTITTLGGIVTVTLVAPKVWVAVDALGKRRRFFKDVKPNESFRTYSSKGYFTYRQVDEITWRLEITDKGKNLLLRSEAERLRLKRTKEWDGKWRMVIFDIPRKHNTIRDLLRWRLKKMGMFQLQESVFVSPFPCWEEVDFWASLYDASDFIRVIVADEINDDGDVRKFFDL